MPPVLWKPVDARPFLFKWQHFLNAAARAAPPPCPALRQFGSARPMRIISRYHAALIQQPDMLRRIGINTAERLSTSTRYLPQTDGHLHRLCSVRLPSKQCRTVCVARRPASALSAAGELRTRCIAFQARQVIVELQDLCRRGAERPSEAPSFSTRDSLLAPLQHHMLQPAGSPNRVDRQSISTVPQPRTQAPHERPSRHTAHARTHALARTHSRTPLMRTPYLCEFFAIQEAGQPPLVGARGRRRGDGRKRCCARLETWVAERSPANRIRQVTSSSLGGQKRQTPRPHLPAACEPSPRMCSKVCHDPRAACIM